MLAVDGEAGAAVLLPALFGGLGAEGLLLAVADDANAVGGNACGYQCVLGGVGTILSESQVVFIRSALVAVAADDHLDVRMANQERGVLGQDSRGVVADVVGVVVEEGVLHVGLELVFFAHGVAGHGNNGRRIHGDAGGCVRGSAGSSGREVITGG